MYNELRDQSGNLSEAGYEVPGYQGGEDNINPYLANFGGVQLNNGSARYSCGSYLGIWFGLVPQPGSSPLIFAEMGTMSGWDPSQAFNPTEEATEVNPVWLFLTAPGNFTSGTDPVGIATACTGCSVTKVTSIGQHGDVADGSTFGLNEFQQPSIFWADIRYGEWQTGCEQGALCTLVYSENQNAWYAGEENYPDSNSAIATVNSTGFAYQSYDGVDTNGGIYTLSTKKAAGPFNIPALPTCGLDSKGYCVASASTAPTTVCTLPGFGTQGVTHTIYQILNAKKVLTVFNHSSVDLCTSSQWSPSNPAVTYNDSNLP